MVPYDTMAGVCARCGRKLNGRQRRWCGPDCQRVYEENHYWQLARPAALRRDHYRCVKCVRNSPGAVRYTPPATLEVNHKIPRNGRGYDSGCHHHLSNLETLCHYHHVEVTRRQRIARSRVKSRRGDQAQERLSVRTDYPGTERTELDENPDA